MTLSHARTLAEAVKDQPSIINAIEGDVVVASRLREIGFIRGESVTVRGRAPFGDPIIVEIRGAIVALRKSEAECVKI